MFIVKKTRIVMITEEFNRKISLLTKKLNITLKKKSVRCYIWSTALYVLATLASRIN